MTSNREDTVIGSVGSNDHSFRRQLHFLLCLAPLFLLLLTSCTVNPVTGKKQLSFMSPSQEESIGAQSDRGIVAQYGLVKDPALQAYVDSLGQAIVKVSHIPEEDFVFRVLDDDVVNAFALPGGYVYVTRGILAYLNDEAALVGVMGHEVGHVAARHSAQRYTQQVLVSLGLGLGSALSETLARYSQLTGTAAQLLLLKYSRDDESQADELGVEYATKLGYDTAEMARFFHTLDRLTSSGGRLPVWASTHPDPGDRFQRVTALSRQAQARSPGPFRVGRNHYLRHLEGLVFGKDPRQGYVRDGWFIHPTLRFRFPVPEGWKLMNSASQVQMAPEDGRAVVFFSAEAPDDVGLESAARSFTERAGLVVETREHTTIDGHPALLQWGRIQDENRMIAVQSTFISWSDQIYAFHGLSEAMDFTRFRPIFTSIARGFTDERDPERLGVRPVRLHLAQAPRRDSFPDLARRWSPPADSGIDLVGLALLNGLETDAMVPAGTWVKVLGR